MAIKFGKEGNSVPPNTKEKPTTQNEQEQVTPKQEIVTVTPDEEKKSEPKTKEKKPAQEKKTPTEKKAPVEKKKPLAGLQVDGPGKNYSIYLETSLVEEIDELGAQQGIKNRSKIVKHLLKQALEDLKNK